MKWRKLNSFLPHIDGMTHAAMPTYFEGEIYFSPRDRNGCSHIYKAPFSPRTQKMGLPVEVATPGVLGEFDDAGAMVSWVRRDGPRVLIYYIGWNLGMTVPFRNAIGLMVNGDKTIGPILDRSRYDPIGVGSCCWGLRWYLSILGWGLRNGRKQAIYHIVNGDLHSIAISFKDSTEYAIARPCVRRTGDLYQMWFCYRGEQYRIGYAESSNGISWKRKDYEMDLEMGGVGEFDDTAQAYPYVFDEDGARYMLLNGNNYGKTGFGLAVLD